MINRLLRAFPVAIVFAGLCGWGHAAAAPPAATASPASFKVLVVTSCAKDHSKMIAAATPMLTKMAADNRFHVDITSDDTVINDANLARYQVFLQLQEAPFDMSPPRAGCLAAIHRARKRLGRHSRGRPDGEAIPRARHGLLDLVRVLSGRRNLFAARCYQQGTLVIEDHRHPVTRNLPDKMVILDEWYEFNESPRGASTSCACGRIDLQARQTDGRSPHDLDQREVSADGLHRDRPRRVAVCQS